MNKTVVITEEEYEEYKKLRRRNMQVKDNFFELKKKILNLIILSDAINDPGNSQEDLLSIIVDTVFDAGKALDNMEKIVK